MGEKLPEERTTAEKLAEKLLECQEKGLVFLNPNYQEQVFMVTELEELLKKYQQEQRVKKFAQLVATLTGHVVDQDKVKIRVVVEPAESITIEAEYRNWNEGTKGI